MTVPDHPLIVAHRGASAHEPDNTLPAFARAVADNADGIEVDVRRSSDDVLVLSHDATLPDGTVIAGTPFSALRRAEATITTLDELLAASGDLMLDIEIKNMPYDPGYDETQATAADVVRWIRRHRLHGRVVVTSFNPDTIAAVRRQDPDIATGRLLRGLDPTLDTVMEVAGAGHEWILPGKDGVVDDPAAAVAIAHEHGLRIMSWTVDDPATITRLAEAGINGIVTNDPGLAHETLTGWN